MTKRSHPLGPLALAVFVPPILIWLVLWFTPNAVTRVGDAGVFVDANVTTSGFLSATMTSVHTSVGTFMVYGAYSAPRGQALVVEDTTDDGLQLCPPGKVDTCVPLASSYNGPMHTVAASPLGLSHQARSDWNLIALFWVLIGILALLLGSIANEADDEPESRE